ncbi:predicted protein [Streptomyces sp. C]|nr:predicted protein [Streptomyces sp. C]
MTRAGRRADLPGPPVAIVRACLRDGGGGSPTAVVDEVEFAGGAPPGDDRRRRVPALGVLSRDVGDTRAGFLKWVRASGFGVDCDICTELRRPSWSTVMPP